MRAINHYRLDGEDASIVAEGHTVWDLGLFRRVRRGVEFNFTVDNMLNRSYYETQNYFESQLPGQPPMYRIHGTPGYPITVMAGLRSGFAANNAGRRRAEMRKASDDSDAFRSSM